MRNMEKGGAEISILFPVHDEADTIEKTILEFYQEIGTKLPIEVIVAEDGSTDGTKEVLLQLRKRIPMKLILGEERKGYAIGVKDGLKHVDSDFVFFVDSDGQHIASDFWKLYKLKDRYDLIVGRKIKRADPPHRILISKVFHEIVRLVFRIPLHNPDTAYRLMSKEVSDIVVEETSILNYSFWTEFTVRAFKRGFRLTEVPVVHRRRLKGNTRLYQLTELPYIIISQLMGLFKLWMELRNQQALHRVQQ